jgi:hypothetical protein
LKNKNPVDRVGGDPAVFGEDDIESARDPFHPE